MVKRERAVRSGKNNSLKIGLFVVLVLALVAIGSYQYTTYVTNPSRLKGELYTVEESRDWFLSQPGLLNGPCNRHEDCGAIEVAPNRVETQERYIFPTCMRCDYNTNKCVGANEYHMCDLTNVQYRCGGTLNKYYQKVANPVYCAKNTYFGIDFGMTCGVPSDTTFVIGSIECSPFILGYDEVCSTAECVTENDVAICKPIFKPQNSVCDVGYGRWQCMDGKCTGGYHYP